MAVGIINLQPQGSNPMKTKAVFYHAGCPVCVAAEQNVAHALDRSRFDVEIVHLGQAKARLAEAEKAGVKSVPALVLGGSAYHINFGAGIDALR
jgi:glutaredoxin